MRSTGDSGAGADTPAAAEIRRAWAAHEPVVVATSGTTGVRRLVEHTRDSVEASCRAVSAALGVDPGRDRWLVCVPLRHVAGRAVVLRGEITGTPVTVHERFDVGAVAAAAGACTLVSLVPTQLRRLLDAGVPVRRFRAVLLGGGPVPPSLLTRAGEAGVTVHTTYGLTETFGGCVHDGLPLVGVSLATSPGVGEVLVRGPVLMRRYVDDEEATRAAFTGDGWLRTGDVGRFAADGRLVIVDRLKDLVITGGVNVSPTAVEQVLAAHPALDDVCVAGAPDPEWGERVVAYAVVGAGNDAPTIDELRAFAREQLSAAELPREVRVVAAIPRTPGGKPLRRALG